MNCDKVYRCKKKVVKIDIIYNGVWLFKVVLYK